MPSMHFLYTKREKEKEAVHLCGMLKIRICIHGICPGAK